MKKVGGISACVIFLLAMTPPSWSAGTPEEAKALVAEAIAFYQTNGKDKALEEFSKPRGSFVKGDLYVFVFNPDGTIIAHGGDPKLVGRDFTGVQDPDGKYFAREFIKIGPEGGWVDYRWMNYKTKQVEAKTAYLKRIDDVIIGCGAYK
ncbi:MAG TPA: cache domain-containing protein [Desulfuromonadales bacterium]|jgi:signal transduction histidine kinase